MTQADPRHSTPPTNTSALPDDLPFATLAAAVAPQWGETILRLTRATDQLAARFEQFVGAEKQADTVKACRELADELITFLDGLEDTDQDAAADDEPCDEDTDAELSLGSLDGITNQAKAWTGTTDPHFGDCELDEGDAEPSLGSTGHGSGGPISYVMPVVRAGDELAHDCEGDEHDGTEPEDEDYDGKADDEPSLGWTVDGVPGDRMGSDGELQDHLPVRPQNRTTHEGPQVRSETGFMRRRLRGLTQEQEQRLKEAMRASAMPGVSVY